MFKSNNLIFLAGHKILKDKKKKKKKHFETKQTTSQRMKSLITPQYKIFTLSIILQIIQVLSDLVGPYIIGVILDVVSKYNDDNTINLNKTNTIVKWGCNISIWPCSNI